MSQQTAVEQLMIALYEGGYLRGNGNEMDDILEKYKEVEKQQIIDAYCQGCKDISDDDTIFPRETSEEYYNKFYNPKNQIK